VRVAPDDADLVEHRESHAIDVEAGLRDVLRVARFLTTEVVGRKAHHHQAPRRVAGVQRLEPGVLRREAALAGGIDHQQHLAGVLAQRLRLAVLQPRHRVLQQRRAGGRRALCRRCGGGRQQHRDRQEGSKMTASGVHGRMVPKSG
jgi:hypothetical protein